MKEKFILCFLLLLFLSSVVYADDSQTFGPDSWEQYRMVPENNPVYNSDFSNEINTTIQSGDEVRSTPVIINNNAYIGNHNTGEIYAYDVTTGELQWKNKAPNWIHSEIIFANNQMFVGYGNRFMKSDKIRGTGKSGLISLDPESGKILWDFETDGQVMPTPVYYNDTVYITTGDRHLYGINPEKGKEKWSLELNSIVSMSAPSEKDGVLYVGGAVPSVFQAIDLDKGEVIWKREFPDIDKGIDDVPPVVYNNLVITTGVIKTDEDLTLREIYNKEGKFESYKAEVKKAIGNVINKHPEKLYDHRIYAMDIKSGEVVWEKSLGKGQMVPNNKSGAPMIYDEKVFVGSPITKSFYAFDGSSGEKLWSKKAHINKAPPVAENNIVYFGDTEGLIHAFDTDSGELLGRKMLGGKLAPSGPILMNNHLVVGSQDSNVYILPTKEILQANDSVNDDGGKSYVSFIFFMYILPIIILVGIVTMLFIVIKRLRVKKG